MTKRRDFIKKSLLGTAGIAIGGMGFSSKYYASIIGANECIIATVVGIDGRGSAHVSAWCSLIESVALVVLAVFPTSSIFGLDMFIEKYKNLKNNIKE